MRNINQRSDDTSSWTKQMASPTERTSPDRTCAASEAMGPSVFAQIHFRQSPVGDRRSLRRVADISTPIFAERSNDLDVLERNRRS
jgi:hypothetical protein